MARIQTLQILVGDSSGGSSFDLERAWRGEGGRPDGGSCREGGRRQECAGAVGGCTCGAGHFRR
jgi:hypothetical protein